MMQPEALTAFSESGIKKVSRGSEHGSVCVPAEYRGCDVPNLKEPEHVPTYTYMCAYMLIHVYKY